MPHIVIFFFKYYAALESSWSKIAETGTSVHINYFDSWQYFHTSSVPLFNCNSSHGNQIILNFSKHRLQTFELTYFL